MQAQQGAIDEQAALEARLRAATTAKAKRDE
jgi:hypothetical protein